MAASVKRERSSNWSLAQITYQYIILTDFIQKKHYKVLKAKQSNLITNAKQNMQYICKRAVVTKLVTAVGIQRRSVEQVKLKWGNLQQGAKKTFTKFLKHVRKTGRVPLMKPPTAPEEKIIDLMKDKPNFSGIAGGKNSKITQTKLYLIPPT